MRINSMTYKEEIKKFNKTSKIKITNVVTDGIVYLGFAQTISGKRLRKNLNLSFPLNSSHSKALETAKSDVARLSKRPEQIVKTLEKLESKRKERQYKRLNTRMDNCVLSRIEQWLSLYPKKSSQHHYRMFKNVVLNYPAWNSPVKNIADVTKLECEQFKLFLSSYKNTKKKVYDDTSKSNIISSCKSFFKWLVKMDFLEKSPAAFLEFPKPEKDVIYFTVEELDKICNTLTPESFWDLREAFTFLRFTGIRPVDLRLMTFDRMGRVDENGIYTPHDTHIFIQHKTTKKAYIPIGNTPQLILKQQFIKHGCNLSSKVFKLKAPSAQGLNFKEWLKLANVDVNGRTFYKAKHGLASQLGAMGLSEREIGLQLGHSGSYITKRYISPELTRVRDMQEKIDPKRSHVG